MEGKDRHRYVSQSRVGGCCLQFGAKEVEYIHVHRFHLQTSIIGRLLSNTALLQAGTSPHLRLQVAYGGGGNPAPAPAAAVSILQKSA